MENHNTHIVSEQSKDEHGYRYDNYGNVIVDSIDDLIYDKFVDIKRKPKEEEDTKKFIKNIINKNDYPPVTPKQEEKKESSESEPNETEEKNQKRKSLININMVDKSKSESEEEKSIKVKVKVKKKMKKAKIAKKKIKIEIKIIIKIIKII